MATTRKNPNLRDATPEVEAWVQTTMVMIEAAGSYAEGCVYDPEVEGMLRRMRATAAALVSALMPTNMPPPPPTMFSAPTAAAQPSKT